MTAYVDRPLTVGMHSPESRINRSSVMTWNGPIQTEMYGQGLRNLCKNTELNLSRLSLEMQKLDPCLEYGMQHWHPTSRPASTPAGTGNHEDMRVGKWNVMFADSSKPLDEASPIVEKDSQWDSYTDPPAAVNFCYLCSTLEEHRRHMLLHKPKKRPRSARPRIEYVAPRPRQKRRPDDVEPRVRERLYKVDVYTSDVPGAGSNANVYITVKGSLDLLPRTQLKKKHGSSRLCFVAGSREVFYTKGPLLGNLQILTIEHDGTTRKQGWHLDRVEVMDVKAAKIWVFKCEDWLSTFEKPHYSNKRDLMGEDKQAMPLTDYMIEVHTGKQKMAGTDADVFITLTGQHGHSKKIHLVDPSSDKKCFEKNGVDQFRMRMYSLGELRRIRIEHDGKGFAAGWCLDKVIVEDSSRPKEKFYFTYGGWIARDEGDGRLWRDIPAKKSLPKELKDGDKIKYQITVKTGDVKYAGTDANVFIQMVGANGATPKLTLDDAKNNFERNMVDNFDVEAVNVGPLDHIVVGHDNSGPGSGWFLEKVNIRRYLSRREVIERLKKMKKRLKKGRVQRRDGNAEDLSSDDECRDPRQRDLRERERQNRKDEKRRKKSGVGGNFFSVTSSSSSSSSDSEDETRMVSRRRLSSLSRGRRTSSGSRRESSASRRESLGNRRESADRQGRRESIYGRRDSRRASSAGRHGRASTSASGLAVRDQMYSDDDDRVTELKVPQYEDYTIICQRWLAKDEDDGLFVREFPITTKSTYFKEQ